MAADSLTRPLDAATYNLLFVCTGNTCRSPMAAAAARRELEQRGWPHVAVDSAGTAAEPGAPASRNAVLAAAGQGLDLSGHRAQPLSEALVQWADLVLVMGPAHRAAVRHLGGDAKVALLGDFAAGEDGRGDAIADPFGGDRAEYDATLLELRRLVTASLDRLAPILHP